MRSVDSSITPHSCTFFDWFNTLTLIHHVDRCFTHMFMVSLMVCSSVLFCVCGVVTAGTWSPFSGLTAPSDCEPCPAGRVCGVEQMTNLTQSLPCPAGHTCGESTSKTNQFSHPCPAGYYCSEETAPESRYASICDAGYYCQRGTKSIFSKNTPCSVGYYCPPGTIQSHLHDMHSYDVS